MIEGISKFQGVRSFPEGGTQFLKLSKAGFLD